LAIVSVNITTTDAFGSQESCADGVSKLTGLPQTIVVSCPQSITGAFMSSTLVIILNGAETFPQASTALQVLFTEYDPAQAPGVVVSTNVRVGFGSQPSLAIGAVAKTGNEGHLIIVSLHNDPSKTGGVTSVTIIV
jgi:hypothetical protein